MADSGSSILAINAEKKLPDHTIARLTAEARAKFGETACQGIQRILGSVNVEFEADGEQASVRFNHMKVKVPTCSVGSWSNTLTKPRFTTAGGKYHELGHG